MAPPTDSEIREQLARILSSDLFTRSERLSSFLRFVTEQTLAGDRGSLKEQSLGAGLYGKGADFNGAVDPIVRVDARRLRDKLREYYADYPHDPVIISLPKGNYAPSFAARLPMAVSVPVKERFLLKWWAALIAGLLALSISAF